MKNNAKEILSKVTEKLNILETYNVSGFKTGAVCEELSIFDWWTENLSKSKLRDMKKFLEEAIKLGYTGYVCFKVGAKGCSNGMWAHKLESTDGYSPDGECIYKSFTPSYNYWQVKTENGDWLPGDDKGFDSIKTVKQLEALIKSI